ncbi:MAG TPA: hypothetical protein VML75_09885 [Kofleriaceae bacterium]|nr:hypothetical protein [Kofleriaceae bacterium]
MSLKLLAFLAAFGIGPGATWAQQGEDRFFVEKDEPEDAAEDDTLIQGSLTSTTFGYRETAPVAQALTGGLVGVENASPIDRVYTDLRGQLDARHLKGSSWDARADARIRMTPEDFAIQAGAYGGDEYDVRELYLKRYGQKSDLSFGRQYILEAAATKIDGIRVDYDASDKWRYIGFLGLYPDRTSRSVLDDYPKAAPLVLGGEPGSRILPVAGGAAAAYRFQRYYGAVGATAILPRGDEQLEGAPRAERPRVFVSSNGYYRHSSQLDAYHFVVVDLEGSGGRGLTNLSAGGNYRPNFNLRLNASVHRVDTETLNVQAQTRLEDAAPLANTVINNLEVARISSESARVGASASLGEQRFEVSVSGMVRRRPEIRVARPMAEPIVFPAAQAAEVTLGVVDRRSFKGYRAHGGLTRVFGFGEENLYRSEANILRLGAGKEFKQGLGEYEVDLSYLSSTDEGRDVACDVLNPLTCYGTSKVNTVSLGGTVFYRIKRDWFLIGNASVASQGITVVDTLAMQETSQPRILITSAFFRAAYRF